MSLSFPPPQRSIGLSRGQQFAARGRAGEDLVSLSFARAVVVAIMIVVTALALLYLWQGWQLSELQARLATRQAAVERMAATNKVLQLEAEQAFSLQRVDLYAKTVLRMVEPSLQYLRLPKEGR